jgi:hypothetical protein
VASVAFEYEPCAKVQYKSVVRLLLCRGASARLPALLLGVNRAKPCINNDNPREGFRFLRQSGSSGSACRLRVGSTWCMNILRELLWCFF